MALISNSLLSDISNSINNKLGTTGTISPVDFATKISQIGGSSPTGTIEITTNGTHNVEAYQYASVSVPTTDEAGLTWNIVNNLSDEHIQIKKFTNFVSENRVLNKTTNKYTIDSFAYNMSFNVYPEWGYRFKSGSTYNINFSETGYSSQNVLTDTLKNYDINTNPSASYPSDLFTTSTLITDTTHNSTNITISGTAQTEAAPGLTTFNTSGLTKTWTGTIEYGYSYSGMYSTTTDFPITDSSSGTRTGQIYDIFAFYDGNSVTHLRSIIEEHSETYLNPMRTKLRSLQGSFYGNYNAFYLQVGDIFIYYPASTVSSIPSETVHILPVNCSIEYLVTYLKSNITTTGDTLTISKWEASS